MEWPKAVALCFHQTWYSPPWRAHLLLSKCGVGLVSHYGQKVHLSKTIAKQDAHHKMFRASSDLEILSPLCANFKTIVLAETKRPTCKDCIPCGTR